MLRRDCITISGMRMGMGWTIGLFLDLVRRGDIRVFVSVVEEDESCKMVNRRSIVPEIDNAVLSTYGL